MPETRALSQTTGDWIVSPQVDFVASRSYVRILEHVSCYPKAVLLTPLC